jgi:hypothetical protein
MTLTDLLSFKKNLQNLMVQEGVEAALQHLRLNIPEGNDKQLILSQFEARLRNYTRDKISGVLSQDQIELSINKINRDLLTFINSLSERDFPEISENLNEVTTPLFLNATNGKKFFQKNYKPLLILVFFIFCTVFVLTQLDFFKNTKNVGHQDSLLNIFIFDKSMSMHASKMAIDHSEIDKYINVNSLNRTSQYVGILIQENSKNQTPYISNTLKCENNRTYSEQKQVVERLKQVRDCISEIHVSPANEQSSDIRGALEMAERICKQDIYKEYKKRIIINSDMKEEINSSLNSENKTFDFPTNTFIYIFGSDFTDFSTFFIPSQKVRVLPAFKVEYITE